MSLANVFFVQSLLGLRTIAIYERSYRVFLFVAILVIGSSISRVIVLIKNPVMIISAKAPPHGRMCLDFPVRRNAVSFYTPVAVDAILYLMTVLRLYHTQPPLPVPGVRRSSTLLSLLYRDGAIYFLAVASAMGLSVVGFYVPRLFGPFSASGLYIAACSIACSRLILHLKESSRRALYQNWRLSGSWYPPMEAIVPSRLTRSEQILGFSFDSPSPEASGSSEEIDMMPVEAEVPPETPPRASIELTSLGSARSPLPSPA